MNLDKIIEHIHPSNKLLLEQAQQRTTQLIMPYRAMGKINDISEKLCAIQGTLKPQTNKRCVFIMASDHGVVEEGVSAYPQIVTCEMIKAFINDMATITVLAKQNNTKVVVCDVGTKCNFGKFSLKGKNELILEKIDNGTQNFTYGPAMSKDNAVKSIEVGFNIADKKIKKDKLNLIATGDMGIGNTTPSAAVASVILEKEPQKIAGKGTLINDEAYKIKLNVIEKAIEINNPQRDDAIDILHKLGGFEIGAIAGVILAAAVNKIPVIIDGFISTAGALIAYKLNPTVKDYMFAGHLSEENGHALMLEYLGLEPILRLNMRLGEGTGATLAMHLVDAAGKIIKEVATFDEANVSEKKQI